MVDLNKFKKTNSQGTGVLDEETCGSFDIKILRDGTWLHEGRPIIRQALVKLFSTVLRCDDTGQHWLQTPVEKGTIEVEDAAFVTTDLQIKSVGGDTVLMFTTNIDQSYEIDDKTPLVVKQGVPYIAIERGLYVRISRPHYYELAEYADLLGGEYIIHSHGIPFTLGIEKD